MKQHVSKPSFAQTLKNLVISKVQTANVIQTTAQKPAINSSGKPLLTSPLIKVMTNSYSAQQIRQSESMKHDKGRSVT